MRAAMLCLAMVLCACANRATPTVGAPVCPPPSRPTRVTLTREEERERARDFIAEAERQPGARRLASGMVFRELRAGDGAHPGTRDRVRVNYRGTLVDGTEFDSSYDAAGQGRAREFPLDAVIACWQEGVPLMTVGSRAVLVCPPEIAYGEHRAGQIPPGSTLAFEIELVSTSAGGTTQTDSLVSPSR